jgi:uncharacterized membrane protein YozB (DUF420 family)
MTVHDLPMIDAFLNGTAGVLLVYGYVLIRQRKIPQHKRVMLSAFGVSCVFLACYLYYHYHAGMTLFPRPGWVKDVYLTILGTHTVLAAIVPVLAIITLNRGLSARFDKHRRIARWTFPIWLYVSVTGVVVYFMLYHIYPLNPVVAIR